MRKNSRLLLSTLFLLFSITMFAQIQQSDLKTYSGEFTWCFQPTVIAAYAKIKGEAKYQYVDNNGEGRIFEGPFIWRAQYGDNAYVFKGIMKNNRQVGEWKYQWDGNDSYITFNEYGNPTGKFEVFGLKEYRKYRGTVLSGIVVGDFFYKDSDFEISGKYNPKGRAVGEWKCRAKVRGVWYTAKCKYSDDGSLLKDWFYTKYDNQTGDTTEHRLYIDAYYYTPHGLQHYTIERIKELMFRDSSF